MAALETRRLLEEIVAEVYDGREHIAGVDRREAERLRGIVESRLGGRATLSRVPVYRWRLIHAETSLEYEWIVVPPYSPSVGVEGRAVRVPGDPTLPETWVHAREGSVAIVDFPGDPDDLKSVALHAREAGFQAVIVGSDRPRVIVGTGVWGYSYTAGAPLPVPVVVVPRSSTAGVENRNVSVVVESRLEEAVGYNIVWGWGDGIVLAGAHYDRWYHGFQDDMLGVAQAIATAILLSKAGVPAGLALFTAEEHGAPGPAGWYWAWGSRWMAGQLAEARALDRIRAYVNFDLAGGRPLVLSGAPQLVGPARRALEGLGVPSRVRGWECPECDSLSFAVRGVPTLSVHTLWCEGVREFYHTPRDTPERADMEAASAAVEAVVRAVVSGPDYGSLREALYRDLAPGPLPDRMILETVVRAARRLGWEETYRVIASRWLRPYHVGDYRLDGPAEIEACMFPEACVLRDERVRGVHAVWEPGEERLLYAPRGDLEAQAHYRLNSLLWRVRETLGNG